MIFAAIFIAIVILFATVFLQSRTKEIWKLFKKDGLQKDGAHFKKYIENLNDAEIGEILLQKKDEGASKENLKVGTQNSLKINAVATFLFLSFANQIFAEATKKTDLLAEPGIVITIILIFIPLLVGVIILAIKVSNIFRNQQNEYNLKEAVEFAKYLLSLPEHEAAALLKRKTSLGFQLTNQELAGAGAAEDSKGLINHINTHSELPFVAIKKKALKRPDIDAGLTKLILWYIGCAAFWLLFGTTIGEYLGIKFIAPDADHISWLSFGRLRPVHTNAVFWGWSSLAMLGLGYYIVPMVSNTPIASLKRGWYSLVLINAAILLGSICLMAGISNGGGEYREYIWPVMALFGIALIITLINFLQTIAKRTTKEIYVSNWYIVSALIFAIVITVVAYLPFWQDGLGETIIQGYYMHQGVGMWFMLFTLGIVYYFLPQQLNKPIYSYIFFYNNTYFY